MKVLKKGALALTRRVFPLFACKVCSQIDQGYQSIIQHLAPDSLACISYAILHY